MSHASCLVALTDDELGEHGSVQAAIEFQMLPFDENGEWFKKGSRWDWWQVGGRYGGRLLGRDHARRRELVEDVLKVYQRKRAHETWLEFEKELGRNGDSALVRSLYDFGPDETADTLAEKYEARLLTAFAFLRQRRWHEAERMGWWGGSAQTECEIDHGPDYKGKCLHTSKELNARIISWAEDWDKWASRFWQRFVKPLDPDTHLVMVDYHV